MLPGLLWALRSPQPFLHDGQCELILYFCHRNMAVAIGRISGRAHEIEALKALDQFDAYLGDVTHLSPR